MHMGSSSKDWGTHSNRIKKKGKGLKPAGKEPKTHRSNGFGSG